MSCNGCRVLRRGCSEPCVLRPCLDWIKSPEAQGNATLFVSKFFGRSDLIAFVSAVPEDQRPGKKIHQNAWSDESQSLLLEACGRTVNPVNGAIGLMSTGNWQVCQAAVETVLNGGKLSPLMPEILTPDSDEASEAFSPYDEVLMRDNAAVMAPPPPPNLKIFSDPLTHHPPGRWQMDTMSFASDTTDACASFGSSHGGARKLRGEEPKLLKLF
ncbi:hypothetical protein RJ639_038238 [Escallonia herrerae]|uniref:LOB domain-containing protein n=1 Tax=Escallonia herrerae TaxID=1293975 RepID=A0AA88WL05_9ASTE|nr:hypothetical protein RJ639_038238 [Escallonia herrerae]